MSEAVDPYALGSIVARLDNYDRKFEVVDRKFETINGSQATTANELIKMNLTLQKLSDQADAREDKAIATAIALEKADTARREKAEQGWAPWTRLAAVVGGLGILLSLILSFYLAFRHNTITQIPTKHP